MTIAPPRGEPIQAEAPDGASLPAAGAGGGALARPTPSAPAVVTAILVVHDGAGWLPQCLDGLAAQHRPPDRLLVVDTGSADGSADVVAEHGSLRRRIGEVRRVELPRHTGLADAVQAAVDQLTPAGATEWLWLLHDDSAAYPQTLERLLDAAQRSASVGIVGPKQVLWENPGRLLQLGIQTTRTGRRIDDPVIGEPDQGQHDDRHDVLAVPTSGMLVRRDLFESLGGFEQALGAEVQDVDLCWRAHRAGQRVVVVPDARLREAAAGRRGRRADGPSPSTAQRVRRRADRRLALAHCAWFTVPFLAVWVVLTSLLSAAVLLVLKRPRQAVLELSDIGAVLTPWRVLTARRRAQRRRRVQRADVVRRRDLVGLFAPARVALRHRLDGIHAAVELHPRGEGPATSGLDVSTDGADLPAVESGPVAAESEQLEAMPSSLVSRVLRHPGFLAVTASLVASLVAWRALLGGGAFSSTARGLAGGELLPVTADSGQLWHTALDAWHGAGLGAAAGDASSSAYLFVLAGLTYLVEHIPMVHAPESPAAVAIGWLLLLAMPLSAWSAYLAGRVATPARWLRAVAAVAWAGMATLSTALAQGRLGPVVVHVLLPLVLAGCAVSARRGPRFAATFATALALAVAGAFVPGLLGVAALAAAGLLVCGQGLARVRALVLLVVPAALLGPWLPDVVDDPALLLGGSGVAVWSPSDAQPWQLALLHPGGAGSYAVLVTAPLMLAGVVALVRRRPVSGAMTALALLAVAGLALGLAARHVVVGRTTDGAPVTVWPGTALDLLALALLAAAVLGAVGLRGRLPHRHRGWALAAWTPLVAVAAASAVAGLALGSWRGLSGLEPASRQAVPAVARDQAAGPLANRLLVLSSAAEVVRYRLDGVEPGPVTRPLPGPTAAADPLLAAAVRTLLSDSSDADTASDRLSDLAVGFVGFRGSVDAPLVRKLDATAGLTRLSDIRGLVLWRVLPRQAATVAATGSASAPGSGSSADAASGRTAPPLSVAPSRARVEDRRGIPMLSLDVVGPHGGLQQQLPAATVPRQLVLAEPTGWEQAAQVTLDGRVLTARAGAAQPTYDLPAGGGWLSVQVSMDEPAWRWAQLVLLALVVFLAVPFGRASRRRRG